MYIEALSKTDLIVIAEAMYPDIDKDIVDKIITFNSQVMLTLN